MNPVYADVDIGVGLGEAAYGQAATYETTKNEQSEQVDEKEDQDIRAELGIADEQKNLLTP